MEIGDMKVWRKAKGVVVAIYSLTKKFPREELYGLTDQLRRSSNSICANIAEGFSRFHAKDKIKFYYNARGSVTESLSHIVIAGELGYLSNASSADLQKELKEIHLMLNCLIRSLSAASAKRTNP